MNRKETFLQVMEPADAVFGFKSLKNIADILEDDGFFEAPASTRYHGAYEGGLFDHSLNVMNNLLLFTDRYYLDWCRPQSPYLIGMFHDLCKMDNYIEKDPELCVEDEEGYMVSYSYNSHMILKGHGEKSVMIASTLCSLTKEEVACIRYHMGAFCDKSEWNDYTNAIHVCPNVLWTHQADMVASHILEVDRTEGNR